MKPSTAHNALALSLFNHIPNEPAQTNIIGLDANTIETILNLSVREQQSLSSKASDFLSININKDALTRILSDIKSKENARELEDQFMYSLATNTMMRQLFGMHTTEFCARRKALGLAGKGQHRPNYCDEATEVLIWQQWEKYKELDERHRLLAVAEATSQPLNIVWPAIKRHLK